MPEGIKGVEFARWKEEGRYLPSEKTKGLISFLIT
jgi:hypothetical protein